MIHVINSERIHIYRSPLSVSRQLIAFVHQTLNLQIPWNGGECSTNSIYSWSSPQILERNLFRSTQLDESISMQKIDQLIMWRSFKPPTTQLKVTILSLNYQLYNVNHPTNPWCKTNQITPKEPESLFGDVAEHLPYSMPASSGGGGWHPYNSIGDPMASTCIVGITFRVKLPRHVVHLWIFVDAAGCNLVHVATIGLRLHDYSIGLYGTFSTNIVTLEDGIWKHALMAGDGAVEYLCLQNFEGATIAGAFCCSRSI